MHNLGWDGKSPQASMVLGPWRNLCQGLEVGRRAWGAKLHSLATGISTCALLNQTPSRYPLRTRHCAPNEEPSKTALVPKQWSVYVHAETCRYVFAEEPKEVCMHDVQGKRKGNTFYLFLGETS